MVKHVGWNWTRSTRKTELFERKGVQEDTRRGIDCRSTPKRCRVCRTKCLQNEVGGTSGKLEEYESTKTVQVAARETRRRRSDEIAPCMFSRRRYNKKEAVTVSRKYSQITFCVDKVSQTHAKLLDNNYNFMQRARLGERMLNEQMAGLSSHRSNLAGVL